MQDQAGFWLSPQQKFAWRVQQEALRHCARIACVVNFECAIEPARLREAIQNAVSRHEILRTVFRRQSGMKVPFQVVLDTSEFFWNELDLSEQSAATRARQVADLFEAEQIHETDLENAPALRAIYIKSSGTAVLILSLPSLCGDARSMQVLVRELGEIYAGKTQELPEPFRYVQFAQWQSDLLDSEDDDARQGREFWTRRAQSSGDPPPLPLQKRESEQFRPARITSRVGEELTTAVLSDAHAPSVLFAAWLCLLSRLTGQTIFISGFFAENREYEELHNAIGCFGRILPISARVENSFSFSDVLRQTRETLTNSVAVQEYFAPELIGLDGELVSFCYLNLSEIDGWSDTSASIEQIQVLSERFKLRLQVLRRGGELSFEFHYDAARFERSAVERIAGYYQTLLAAALATPDVPVSRLPLLAAAERRLLLTEWNQTTAAYPAEQCLHELFQQQASQTPERIAVRCGEHALSYRELNQQANQLAHYLRRQGVGPDDRVGLCLERSTASLVAVLGILKAGAAYVPLNADNPPARLKQQLAGAKALITEAKFAAQMPQFSGTTLLLDGPEQPWSSESKANPETNTTPANLVYVIYTSGSTGVPKGVAVRHQNLVNYADFISKKLHLDQHPDGLQFATVSTLGADLGNTAIYPALISGGSLHLIAHEVATDPQQFAQYTAKHPMDVLKIVPSHLHTLLQSSAAEAKRILPRKYLITGGEALTPKLLEKIASLNPGCEILNHYGPTETTVGSLTLELKHYDWKKAGLATIPIGRPIQNTQVYILDPNLEPVPVGVTGELYIAGAGVTAGYLEQAEKTAERFVQNPFSSSRDPNAKMYRTGDLARYGEDGNIEFLGRGDDQVKIRGFRIELGEIESVLVQHGAIRQAVVLARSTDATDDASSDKRLLAYVVLHRETGSNGHGAITGDDLRHYLQQQLPDYMVPQAVMILAKLPLNANGKLDRQALPEPEQAPSQKAYVAPRNQTEQTIAEIWAEVLRRDPAKISMEDNFFDLGGHSLLATQVVSRLRQRFMVEVPMRAIFDCPRISGLAEAVEQAPLTAIETEEISITPAHRDAYRAGK